MTTWDKIEAMRLDLEIAEQEYLRERSWISTAATPSHLILWTCTTDNHPFMVSREVALMFQSIRDRGR